MVITLGENLMAAGTVLLLLATIWGLFVRRLSAGLVFMLQGMTGLGMSAVVYMLVREGLR